MPSTTPTSTATTAASSSSWDRLFGSFAEERDDEPCVWGTRAPLHSWNPLWANLEVYAALARDAWHTRRWRDKLRVWIAPPGWRPDDVAQRLPKPPFDLRALRRWDPAPGALASAIALLLFVALLGATVALLWNAHRLDTWSCAALGAAIVAGMCGVGRLGRGGEPQVSNSPPADRGGAMPRWR